MVPTDRITIALRTARWRRRVGWLVGGAALLAICVAIRVYWGAGPANADQSRPNAANPPAQPVEQRPDYVAIVNGEKISRNDLGLEALAHYGAEVLESLMNKHLIVQRCQVLGISVTQDEVSAEIARMAERFSLPTEQWLRMLKEERNITPAQYAKDIIWPTIALRKLAAQRVEPTPEEVQAAYETQFGPAVQVRLIACDTVDEAQQIRAVALKAPDEFGNLAKQHSKDLNSASAKGLIQPIRMHVGDALIQKAAFGLQPGQISDVLPVERQFVLLKCESIIPARPVPIETVGKVLTEACRDKKLRLMAGDVFEELQRASQIENVFNDPQKRRQFPGVAAIINGTQITMVQLADECIERHGVEVLEGMINRRILEQACRQRKLAVSEQDIDEEIARAAVMMGVTLENGQPDIPSWLKRITEEQGTTVDLYRRDVVWPSAALKKLVQTTVKVDETDLQKGYESNFGPRVRCRAIVLNQHRKAQEVWEMAKKNPTAEAFGDLAEQFSVETASRSLRGEVPPIRRHSGQPILEKEAFALQPGEISGIIQVTDKFVILFCEGFTEPQKDVDRKMVEREIYEDVYEKKLRLAMAREFARLQDSGTWLNGLTGEDHKPVGASPADTANPGTSLVPALPAGASVPPPPATPRAGAAPRQ